MTTRRKSANRAAAPTAKAVAAALAALGSPQKAANSARFFKTAPGGYGHGDRFFGVTVPEQRRLVRRFRDLPLPEIARLLDHEVHECRLTALLVLADQYRRGDAAARGAIAAFYLARLNRINNWDLVDASARDILGEHLVQGERAVLYRLARSDTLWARRVAIIATHAFIRRGEYDDTLRIAELLLGDRHDLIHKAAGWMLREVANRAPAVAEAFLDRHAAMMPRTMLRYAVEKLPERKRKAYMAMKMR